MKNFYKFIQKMGGMHDAVVTRLVLLLDEGKIEFHIDDIYSNFEGLPEYPGQQSGSIVLHGVNEYEIVLDGYEHGAPLRVFEFLLDENEPEFCWLLSARQEISVSDLATLFIHSRRGHCDNVGYYRGYSRGSRKFDPRRISCSHRRFM
jgi:hypothetical protein